MTDNNDWDIVVKPKNSMFRLNLGEVWNYRDLITLLVKRDLTAIYKQTILGPLWMFIQPMFATLVYTFTFGQANLSTDGIPALLFYLVGQTFWSYFSECLNKTSTTFISNASVFGKVYFPRLVMPFSVIISNLARLGIQTLLLVIVYFYYYFNSGDLNPQPAYLILFPMLIVMLGLLSLSLGILFSALTTKYRDFTFLLGFAVQLIMFLSCVVFPVSMFSPKIQSIILFNPVASCLEAVRFILTGHGYFSVYHLLIGTVITLVTLILSVMVFNRTERTFMDTV